MNYQERERIEDFEARRERFMRATEPLAVAIGNLHAVFFKGWLITSTGSEAIYHDGHAELLKQYNDEIDRLKQYYFPEEKRIEGITK